MTNTKSRTRSAFLDTLKRYCDEHKIEIHAYCLMENHVHLLIRDAHNELDVFMKKLQGSYAFYFNHKYERVGTLFQDRFKSQPVADDAYFCRRSAKLQETMRCAS